MAFRRWQFILESSINLLDWSTFSPDTNYQEYTRPSWTEIATGMQQIHRIHRCNIFKCVHFECGIFILVELSPLHNYFLHGYDLANNIWQLKTPRVISFPNSEKKNFQRFFHLTKATYCLLKVDMALNSECFQTLDVFLCLLSRTKQRSWRKVNCHLKKEL